MADARDDEEAAPPPLWATLWGIVLEAAAYALLVAGMFGVRAVMGA